MATVDAIDPAGAGDPPQDYYERVSKVHEDGGYGSIGYRAPFSLPESQKLLLRTHTTAVSTQMLYNLANQPGGFKPAKMFSIDRVFRNEATDATHLAEFHQVEGVVADVGITLGDLIGEFVQEHHDKDVDSEESQDGPLGLEPSLLASHEKKKNKEII